VVVVTLLVGREATMMLYFGMRRVLIKTHTPKRAAAKSWQYEESQ
jgi:hypothetical protein